MSESESSIEDIINKICLSNSPSSIDGYKLSLITFIYFQQFRCFLLPSYHTSDNSIIIVAEQAKYLFRRRFDFK